MSERELREGLRSAVADEPPLAFDPDRLMGRAEREVRRRRSLVGVGVATAVIAVGAIAVPVALGAGRPEVAVRAAAPTLATTPAVARDIAWPPAGLPTVDVSAADLRDRGLAFTQHLHTVFPELVPAAKALAVQPWGGESSGAVSDHQNYLDSYSTFVLNGVSTAIDLQVDAPGQDPDPPARTCAENRATTCHRVTRPDGSELVTMRLDLGGGAQISTVAQYRPDGSVVTASAYNYDPTVDNEGGLPRPDGPLPLTEAQLTQLATDPVFTL